VDESSRQDDARAELLQDYKDDALLRHAHERCGEDWSENTQPTSHENDEQKPDAEILVVFP
jgi:hypothetical protein